MGDEQVDGWSRRELLVRTTLAATAGLFGLPTGHANAEPPPETRKLRLPLIPDVACFAPLYVAEEFLRAEGFSGLEYVTLAPGGMLTRELDAGRLDLAMDNVHSLILGLDAGSKAVLVSGVHVGCYELFAHRPIRSILELKGKTVGVPDAGRRGFVASMAAHVGLDPRKDINWVTTIPRDSIQAFADGKLDAFMCFPPEPAELRAKGIGHVLVDTRRDKPWSQYFCCVVTSNREFVQRHPVAVRRALRAFLKAGELCASDPKGAARRLIDKGLLSSYDPTFQTLKELPYARWRESDLEATVRFYALRLHEGGLIRTSPHKILAQSIDTRLFNELKKELKG